MPSATAGGQQYVTSTTNVSLNLVQLFEAPAGGWEPIFPNLPDAETRDSP
jgi:hypothetical protein